MADTFQSKYTGQEIDSLLDVVQELRPESSKDYELYCYKKCYIDSNPYTRIHYGEDNSNYISAGMNYRLGTFDYGSWVNAFFMKVRPCMLKSDGTVDYYLDPNDYSKKEDGTDSDVGNLEYDGNAMIEWPVIWVKREMVGVWGYVYICNKQLDESYKAYSNVDKNGNLINHFYTRIYEGHIKDSKMRSMSGVALTHSTTASSEISAAVSNGEDWYTGVWADRALINDLLILIGKSTNTQAIFGYGFYSGATSAGHLKKTGLMDTKGLFWGDKSNTIGVKIFGMENWWGNAWERIAGYMYVDNTIKVKLTWDMTDGSTINGYNITGDGYIEIPNSKMSGTSGGYIYESYMTDLGEFPLSTGSNADTYDTDGLWYSAGTNYAYVGGDASYGLLVGAFCVGVGSAASYSCWSVVGGLSCKPRKEESNVTI